MNTIQKLGKLEAIGLYITIVANFVIFNMPAIILQVSGSSSWINIIYVGIIAFFIILLIVKLFKRFPTNDIVDVAKFTAGSFLGNFTAIFYMFFFMAISVLALSYFTLGLKLIYFQLSPIPFILMLLLIPPLIANYYGLRVIAGVNRIFIPVILVSIFVIFFSSFSDFSLERFFPVLGFGINKTFGYGLTNIFAFTGLAYLYFLPPFLKEHKDFKSISILGIVFAFLFLLISIVSLLHSFPAIASTDELFSLYLLTRLISFGKFFQRVDAIFILLWILGFFSFISLNFFLILQLFKKTCKIKHENGMIYALGAIVFSACLLLKNIAVIKFLYRDVFKYLFIFFAIFFNITLLIIANIKKKRLEN